MTEVVRIPHGDDPVEIRQAFQRLKRKSENIDISDDTNLAVTAPIVLTGDTLSITQAGIDHGSIGGLLDDDHTIYILADGTRDLTGNLAVDALVTIDGRDISVDGAALDAAVALQGTVGVDAAATPGYLGAAANSGVLRASTGLSYADGGDFVTLTTNDGEIVHDSLSGYDAAKHLTLPNTITNVLSDHNLAAHTALGLFDQHADVDHNQTTNYDANKHVDHTGVTITTGSGITGGGDISTNRTFDLDINSLAAAGIAAGDFVPFWDITATATNKKITFANFEGALNHASLTGYVANEHINHTTVSISSGVGLSGGGTIASTRTLALDIDGLTLAALAGADTFAFHDETAGTVRKVTWTTLEGTINHASITGTHNLTTDINHSTITGAHNLTTDIDHATITGAHNLTTDIDHNQLTNYVADQHIDWTNASDALLTSSTGQFAYLGVGVSPASIVAIYAVWTAVDVANARGMLITFTSTITANSAIGNYGLDFIVLPDVSTGITNTGNLMAIRGSAVASAAHQGTLRRLKAMQFGYGSGAGATGVITYCMGLELSPYIVAGTIGILYDILINAPLTGGAITSHWSLYNDSTADSFFASQVGFGINTPDARLEVETGATEGKQAVTIDQNDSDQVFIDFQGTSAADAANSITTWTTGNSIQGFVWVEINGVKKRMPYYDEPTS